MASRGERPQAAGFARRSLPWLAPSGYGLVLAWRAAPQPGPGLRFVAFAAVSMMLARAASLATGRPRRLVRLALSFGAVALSVPTAGAWSFAFLAAAGGLASLSAFSTILLVPSPGGLLDGRPTFPTARAWSLAGAWGWPFASAVASSLGIGLPGAAYAEGQIIGAGAFTYGLLGASLGWARFRRDLELGVPHRLGVALATLGGAAVLAVALILPATTTTAQALPVTLAAASWVIVTVALARDAVAVARFARRGSLVAGIGAFVGFFAFMGADNRREGALACLLTAFVAAAAGALWPALEKPMRPQNSLRLDAIAAARAVFRRFEPDDAVREALLALREAAGPGAVSPELWTLWPQRLLTVDAAGYGRERPAELPKELVSLVAGEPEATLRYEVLVALDVRRPHLRPLLHWLETKDLAAVTLVTRGGEAEGLLALPRGRRSAPLVLEEARALKELADAFAGACAARAALARSHERELVARTQADAREDQILRLNYNHALDEGRFAMVTAHLAAPAAVGLYSAAARLAHDALERRAEQGAPIAVIAPGGIDPVPWLARVHREGPRGRTPFVVVEGTASDAHRPELWSDPLTSPLAFASRGTLVLRDGAALPLEVQKLIARALAERRTPWERAEALEVILWFAAVDAPNVLVERGLLDDRLASRLADSRDTPIALPRLRDRAEDLRALVVERLAREGLRARGTPVGIESAAFALLVEHPFPGEEAELDAIVVRLVARVDGPVVRAEHVLALGLERATLAEVRELRPSVRRA